eukprot:GHVS01058006.1.p1 GENE.GHVS01058006.1~~GHVS01058006.1.p1  ORF type:complete len:462 (+),score=84.66 GHVS01058006.1:104-1489(+)
MSVRVVVLGDVGRSPRMQRQALAFADHMLSNNRSPTPSSVVYVIGYFSSAVLPSLSSHPLIRFAPLSSLEWLEQIRPPSPSLSCLLPLFFLTKLLLQTISLLFVLLSTALCNRDSDPQSSSSTCGCSVESKCGSSLGRASIELANRPDERVPTSCDCQSPSRAGYADTPDATEGSAAAACGSSGSPVAGDAGSVGLCGIGAVPIVCVQNPPSVPSVPLCWLVCRCLGWRLWIDWHNFGWTLLMATTQNQQQQKQHQKEQPHHQRLFGWLFSIVRGMLRYVYMSVELWFGRRADMSMCVSAHMRDSLQSTHNVQVDVVLYDKPAHSTSTSMSAGGERRTGGGGGEEGTIQRSAVGGSRSIGRLLRRQKEGTVAQMSHERKALFMRYFRKDLQDANSCGDDKDQGGSVCLCVTSTSWTEDEDMYMLLDALAMYDQRCIEQKAKDEQKRQLPDIVLLVTVVLYG